MLVFTRKKEERFYVGDDVCITVVHVDGGKVRIGVDAPRDVLVLRAELVPPGCKPSDVFRPEAKS